jgi:hypothetical protein
LCSVATGMCVESEGVTFRLYMTFPNGGPLSRVFPFAAVDVEVLFAANIMDVGVAVPLLVVNRVLATSEAPARECRNAVVTLVESAEASVVRNRAATSDKRERLANRIEPPKPNSNASGFTSKIYAR